MSQFWRIRVKRDSQDFAEDAWELGQVGAWYGGWNASDLISAGQQSPSDIAHRLNELPSQRELGWSVTATYVNTVFRLMNISHDDWIVLYLSKSQELALAQCYGEISSDQGHPLNAPSGEIFKYRKITNKKTFKLSHLPDAYRLLPTQGRGNVHNFIGMTTHVRQLAESASAAEVCAWFAAQAFDDQLDLLGASAWESFCFAYLIFEEGFVPTGLSVGRTLAVADIIGRSRLGYRIVAQCKKDPWQRDIEPDFLALANSLGVSDKAYYFAYGGMATEAPANVRVIDKAAAADWSRTANGRLYQELLTK